MRAASHRKHVSFEEMLNGRCLDDDYTIAKLQGINKRSTSLHHTTCDTSEVLYDTVPTSPVLSSCAFRFVGPFVPRKERMKSRDNTTFTNVYIKNFDDGLTDEGLRELFSQYGTITSCKVMRKEDGSSKGFGFCAFEDASHADAAVKDLHEKDLGGNKVLYVSRAQKRSERDHELQKLFHQKKAERQKTYQGVNLYIKNLEEDINDEQLRREFSAYGSISSAKVRI